MDFIYKSPELYLQAAEQGWSSELLVIDTELPF